MKRSFYEITYIINPVLEEEQFKEVVDQVGRLVEANDGELVEVDEWGVQRLAYEIDGKGNGYYVNAYFRAPAEAIEAIERQLRINDHILRYLTLKYDAKMMRYYEQRTKGELPSIFEETGEEEE